MSDSPFSRLQGESRQTLVLDFLQLFSCQEHLKVTKEEPRPCGRKCRVSSLNHSTGTAGSPNDPTLPPAAIDIAILAHVYHEIENPYEFMYRLHRSLALGARVGIVDLDRPTESRGTPPKLLRCELGALGYREALFRYLKPADGYLMVFVPPDELPPVESIRACSN
jgi:hypothetical protein